MTQGVQAAFFSYCREDSDFALRLAGDLKTAGASVWLDQLDIVPGQRWDHAVQDALASCQRMLVILTPAVVNSTNVMDEVSFALEEGKTVIPVIYKDCAVPFRLRRLQHIDFRTDYARGLKLLLKVLGVEQQVLGPESMPKVSVAPQIVDSATTEKPAGKGEAHVDPNRLGALLRQAEAGNTGAMSELGYMYGTGKGVEEDQQQSFLWYRKAAEAGDVNGMFNVALIYHADGPEKDEGRAVFWYRKAAEAANT